jgi:hypothetical protein
MARSDKKVAKFATIPHGDFPGLYEVQETRYEIPNPNALSNLDCKCCGKRMQPVFDVQQMGFWQDKFNTYFACKTCLKVTVFEYTLSRIEATSTKRHSRRAAQRAV